MEIITKNNDEIFEDLEKIKNRRVRERFLKAQPYTDRPLNEMYNVDSLQLQIQIENLVNYYVVCVVM